MLPRRLMLTEWLDVLAIFKLDLYSFLGIHCVVEMDLFSEFTITVTVPVIGLLLIFLMYRGKLRYESKRVAGSDAAKRDDPEQVDDSTEHHALAARLLGTGQHSWRLAGCFSCTLFCAGPHSKASPAMSWTRANRSIAPTTRSTASPPNTKRILPRRMYSSQYIPLGSLR